MVAGRSTRSLGIQLIVAIVVHVVAPLTLIALLMSTRHFAHISVFLAVFAVCVGLGIWLWTLEYNIMFYDQGPKDAAGFRSWVVPFAVASVGAICVPRTNRRGILVAQAAGSFVVANIWVLYTSWIA